MKIPDAVYVEQALYSLRDSVREELLKAYEPFYHTEASNYTRECDKAVREVLSTSYANITNDTKDLFSYFDQGKSLEEQQMDRLTELVRPF